MIARTTIIVAFACCIQSVICQFQQLGQVAGYAQQYGQYAQPALGAAGALTGNPYLSSAANVFRLINASPAVVAYMPFMVLAALMAVLMATKRY